jgi:hypothetical protein
VYSTFLFLPAVEIYCSEGEDGLQFVDDEFWTMRYPDCYSCGVLESSAVPFR